MQPMMEPKDYTFKKNILNDLESAVESGFAPNVKIPNCDGKKATPSAITREELIAKQMSRMNK